MPTFTKGTETRTRKQRKTDKKKEALDLKKLIAVLLKKGIITQADIDGE